MEKRLSARERYERRREINIPDLSVCYLCKQTNLNKDDKFCLNCGFPQGGTQSEQWKFIIENRKKKSAIRESQKIINRGRNILFIVAALNILPFLFGDNIVLLIGLIISGIYIGLGFWSIKKPFPAILTGLVFYVTLYLFFGILDPMNFLRGLMWKVIISGALLFALYSIKDLEKLKKEVVK